MIFALSEIKSMDGSRSTARQHGGGCALPKKESARSL